MIKVGTIITGSSGNTYRVQKKLGEGVTSEVYQALAEKDQTLVAIKVLRRGVGQIIADNFWQEGQILGHLVRAEEQVGDGLSNVPRVLDQQREGEVRFLVLELVTGTPLDRLVEEQGFLEEQEALQVASQVLRVLDLLHQQVRRTYTDFQLQNIWLQRGEDGEINVKVMDWNHVSKKVPDNQPLPDGPSSVRASFGAADLARFGAYFYRMLTGKGANEKGEKARALEKRAGEQWKKVSLGSRQLLLRALHPNPARRFTTAAEFRQAVQDVQEWWQKDTLDLMIAVGNLFKKLSDKVEAKEAERIAATLDIAERLGANRIQVRDRRQQLEQQVGRISVTWKAGKQYYESGQYRTAAEKWQEEAYAQGRVELWRWVMLAQAGVEFGPNFTKVRQKLEQVIQALEQNQAEQARKILSALPSDIIRSQFIAALEHEATARLAVSWALAQENEPNSWAQAAKAYRQAEKSLQAVPYHDLLRDEEGWFDLAQRAQELKKKSDTRSQASQAMQKTQSLLSTNFNQGLENLKETLRRDPQNKQLAQLCLSEGQRLTKQPKQAVQLLEVGVLFAQVPELTDELQQAWKEALTKWREQEEKEQRKREEERHKRESDAKEVQLIKTLLKIANEVDEAVKNKQWHKIRPLVVDKIQPGSVYQNTSQWQKVRNPIEQRFDDALKAWEEPLARELMAALAVIDLSGSQRRKRNYDEMVAEMARDLAEEEQQTRAWLKKQGRECPPEKYGVLKEQIENRLLSVGSEQSDLRRELEQARQKLKKRLQRREAEQWIQEGQQALQTLSQEGLANANLKFQQAQEQFASLNGKKAEQKKVEADNGRQAVQAFETVIKQIDQAQQDLKQAQQFNKQGNWVKSEVHLTLARRNADSAEQQAKTVWRQLIKNTPPSFARITTLQAKINTLHEALQAEIDALRDEEETAADISKPNDDDEPVPMPTSMPLPKWMLPMMIALLLLSLAVFSINTAPLLSGVAASSEPTTIVTTTPQISNNEIGTKVAQQEERLLNIEKQLATVIEVVSALPTNSPESTAPISPTPTPTATETPTETPQPNQPPIDVNDLDNLSGQSLYDIPILTGQAGDGWTLQTDELEQLQVTSDEEGDGTQTIVVLANDVVVTGTVTLQDDGKAFVWKPNPNAPPLAKDEYTFVLQGFIKISESEPVSFTVSEAQTVIITGENSIYSEPNSSTKPMNPQPIEKGVTVEVIGKIDQPSDAQESFLQIRHPEKRQSYWIRRKEVSEIQY